MQRVTQGEQRLEQFGNVLALHRPEEQCEASRETRGERDSARWVVRPVEPDLLFPAPQQLEPPRPRRLERRIDGCFVLPQQAQRSDRHPRILELMHAAQLRRFGQRKQWLLETKLI